MHNFLRTSLQVTSGAVIILLSLTLAFQTPAASAAEFDIPLSELNKVKKKYPAKSESTKKRKQSKKQQQPQETGQKTTVSATEPASAQAITDNQEKPADIADSNTSTPANRPAPQKDNNQDKPEASLATRISHTPYSFLVPGKRTTIQAVISSNSPVSNVYCYFKSTGSSSGAAVSMNKVAGTRFTYTTTIPALNTESAGLSYKIYAVDSNGVTSQSKEYTIQASSTAVSPGWQTDNFTDSLQIQKDNPNAPLEGFSDPALGKK